MIRLENGRLSIGSPNSLVRLVGENAVSFDKDKDTLILNDGSITLTPEGNIYRGHIACNVISKMLVEISKKMNSNHIYENSVIVLRDVIELYF